MKFTIGGYQPVTSTLSKSCQVFADHLQASLGDRIEIDFKNDIATLGHQPNDMGDLIEAGDLSMGYLALSYFGDILPDSRIFDVPFAVESREQAYAFMDGGYVDTLREQLAEKRDLRLLSVWDYGFRHITNDRHPIRTPADSAGLPLRVLLNPLHNRIFAALGFIPETTQVPDFLTRLRNGEDMAQENALTNYFNFGMHEFHHHITLSAHLLGLANFMCRQSAYQSWPADVQSAVTGAAAAATAAQRKIAESDERAVLAALDSGTWHIIDLGTDERQAFIEALASLMTECREEIGQDLFDRLAGYSAP